MLDLVKEDSNEEEELQYTEQEVGSMRYLKVLP